MTEEQPQKRPRPKARPKSELAGGEQPPRRRASRPAVEAVSSDPLAVDAPATAPEPPTPASPAPTPAAPWRPRRTHPTPVFFVLVALMFAKVLLARALIMGGGFPVSALLSELLLLVGFAGLVDLFFKRWRFTAYLVADLAVSVFLASLTEYATYFDRMLAPGAFRLVGMVGSVWSSVFALFSPTYLLFFLDIPLLLLFAGRLRLLAGSRRRLRASVSVLIGMAIVISPALALWAGVASVRAGDIAVARSHGVLAFESAAVARVVFGYGLFGTASVGSSSARVDPVSGDIDYSDPESIQAAIETISRRGEGDRIAAFEPGAYAGANVIAIQVESLQHFAVDSWVTPNLDALARESWYFPNGFSSTGLGTTSDAEFAMNTSLYPPAKGAACVEYVGLKLPSLPRLLAEQGYHSFTMHVNTARYWNRKELYPAIGFADYYDRAFFGSEDKIGMGMSDELFFRKAFPVISQESTRGPFYCQLVTITPHHPFRMPEETIGIELPSWLKGSTVGNYFEAMNYEDRQIGWFIETLKASGLWDRSIVVIYGDHYGLRPGDLEQNDNLTRLELVLEHKYTLVDKANIPLIIHLPSQQNGVLCNTPVSQVDIMPTLADALGLDLSSTPHLGRSAFEDTRPLIVGRSGLPSGSFVNDHIVFLADVSFDSGTALDIRTGEPTELLPEYQQDFEAARMLESISDIYVRTLPKRPGSKGTEGAVIPKKNGW